MKKESTFLFDTVGELIAILSKFPKDQRLTVLLDKNKEDNKLLVDVYRNENGEIELVDINSMLLEEGKDNMLTVNEFIAFIRSAKNSFPIYFDSAKTKVSLTKVRVLDSYSYIEFSKDHSANETKQIYKQINDRIKAHSSIHPLHIYAENKRVWHIYYHLAKPNSNDESYFYFYE